MEEFGGHKWGKLKWPSGCTAFRIPCYLSSNSPFSSEVTNFLLYVKPEQGHLHKRKAWLFAGSELAGQRAAAITSLIQSAKLNGHDPYTFLKDVLERLPTQRDRDIGQLLPHRWSPRIMHAPHMVNMCWLDSYCLAGDLVHTIDAADSRHRCGE